MSNATLVSTVVNGDAVQFACPTDESLMSITRSRRSTGVKEGCGTGDWCLQRHLRWPVGVFLLGLGSKPRSKEVETVEGSVVVNCTAQEKFIEHAALCGICTPGF